MSLLVQKFGGTSVGDLTRINAVAKIVVNAKHAGHDVAVVVSAMSGETNRLTELGNSLTDLPSAREMDVLLSAGEQVSIALLSIAIQSLGERAKSFLANQIPVHTDAIHQKARIELIETERLKKSISQDEIPVIAGFQGVNGCGDITTIGRGGSDTSAVAIAAALDADECQIYTDVDGVYTADPRICPRARRMSSVSFEEMLEMASLGAKVLHTRAVEFGHKYQVPMRVLSSFEEGPGSLITQESETLEKPLVSAVTHESDVAKLTVVGVPDVPGVAMRILGPIADAAIVVDMIVQNTGSDGRTDFSFTVKRSDFAHANKLLGETLPQLANSNEDADFSHTKVEVDNTIAKVTIVGIGMRSHAGVATLMFDTLARENINILMISTSEIKVSVVIAERYVELAVRALHEAFELDSAPITAES